MASLGFDLCILDLYSLTSTFGMDITSADGNNSRKFHDNAVIRTCEKGVMDRGTRRRTYRNIHRATCRKYTKGFRNQFNRYSIGEYKANLSP